MYYTTLSSIANSARNGAAMRVASALAVAFALVSASGCGLLSENLDRAAKGVGKVVTYYCENVTVPEIREEVRAAVNKHSAPHSVAVTCADGGPAMNSTDAPAPVTGNTAGPTLETGTAPTAWNLWEILITPIFYPERAPIFYPENESANG